jgi:hypothetical protein
MFCSLLLTAPIGQFPCPPSVQWARSYLPAFLDSVPWERWKGNGLEIAFCTIVATDANEMMTSNGSGRASGGLPGEHEGQ